MQTYNVIVIGAGSAGLMVAAGAAGLGARVALVENRKMGGDCLNYGCVPSKALIRSAKTVAHARSGGAGVAPGAPVFDWAGVSGRVQSVIDTIAPHDSVERFESLGVDVVQGTGRLVSPTRVEVALAEGGTRTLAGRAIVITTGSEPAVPPIPGLAEAGYQTNETVFTMAAQPRRLLVIGGGPIGVELGQSFARLGSEVTLAEAAPTILPREDPDAAELVGAALTRDGVRLRTGMRVSRVEQRGGTKVAVVSPFDGQDGAEEQVEVDDILVAVGRRPKLADLGLEAAGVRHGPQGIEVDARMRTSARGVYACGDATGPYRFTHMANQQARVVIQNALLPVKARMDYRVVPWCTFIDPEVAHVGLNETLAAERKIPVRVVKVPFAAVDRAVCDGETEGFVKVLTPPGKDDILGATIVGTGAGDLIHVLILAMQTRLGLGRIGGMVHIYPTRAEIFRRVADEARKAAFTPRMRRIMGGYLRWRNS